MYVNYTCNRRMRSVRPVDLFDFFGGLPFKCDFLRSLKGNRTNRSNRLVGRKDHTQRNVCINMFVCMYVYLCMYVNYACNVCMYVCMYACIYVWMEILHVMYVC